MKIQLSSRHVSHRDMIKSLDLTQVASQSSVSSNARALRWDQIATNHCGIENHSELKAPLLFSMKC